MVAERWKHEHELLWSAVRRSLYEAGVLLISLIFLLGLAVLLLLQL
jgi:hypothetical protein